MDEPTPGDPTFGRVAVAVDPPTDAGNAVRWAAGAARRRGAHLHVVLPADHRGDPALQAAYDGALAAARTVAPDVIVSAAPAIDPPLHADEVATTRSDLLVIAAAAPRIDNLITRARCPLVIVPPHPQPRVVPPVERARTVADSMPVVVAVGPATGPEVIEFAFVEAAARRAGLLAVRTWHDPFVDLARMLPGRVARRDAAHDRARRALQSQLTAAAARHRDVDVETLVIDDTCAELLVAVGLRARLMVLGRPAGTTAMGWLTPSPARVLAHRAPCPVAIVPPPDGPRPARLPEQRPERVDRATPAAPALR